MADGDSTLNQLVSLLLQRQGNPADSIGADDRLLDLGVDSIDMAYLMSHFERRYDADFADEDFELTRYVTVADLAKAIDARIHG
ncbi:acyl carrier protein [Micromonospora halophytica]|uniref:Acyl carrier protein n=1 Tax=Micromonospora halophytica TaxID=47864 RepID=A0A1C5ILR0_9ACTN|nr:acyl carrier protein [Micromonospora halophytica]SCG59280.1 Acyl carrier protein [Micromonospora halophytica]